MKQRWKRQALICVAVVACLWGARSEAQTPKPLRIGLIGPFSGPSSDFGIPMMNGAKLAVDEINAAGGYLGRPIELVIKDDTANPDVGLQLSQELMREGVVATRGLLQYRCGHEVAGRVPASPFSLDRALRHRLSTITAKFPAPDSYIFRTSARDAIQAPFVVNDIVSRGWNRVAILADKTAYGEGGMNDMTKKRWRPNS